MKPPPLIARSKLRVAYSVSLASRTVSLLNNQGKKLLRKKFNCACKDAGSLVYFSTFRDVTIERFKLNVDIARISLRDPTHTLTARRQSRLQAQATKVKE